MTSNIVLSNVEYDVVGTRPVRPDGVDKVTGRAEYGADIKLTGLLHAKILRSPHAHARIKSIDTSAAEAYPGVYAVVTGKDLPFSSKTREGLGNGYLPLKFKSDNVLASNKVQYKGHAVAAVAAVNPHVAEEATELIKVDYEVLPALTNARDAMKEDAVLVHDDNLYTSGLEGKSEKPSNIASHSRFELGDLDEGFAKADVVVEHEFDTKTVHQGYIEPHTATAYWNKDGQLDIWCSTQGPFWVRRDTAELLDHPVSRIKVTPMEIGGGFGGKIPVYLEPVASLLSAKSGHPVKVTMTRAEVFEASGPGAGAWMRVKIGATKDGMLTAMQAEYAFEAGAFPGSPVGQAATCGFSAYDFPNGRADAYDVITNKPKTAAYRAPGSPQASFAVETVVDEICEKIGVDPVEFRLKNAAIDGTRKIEGPVLRNVTQVECINALMDHDHYKTKLEGNNRGRGVATGFWGNANLQSSATLTVEPDGTISMLEGSVDIGGTRASIAMQAAEALELPFSDIKPTVADTDSVGYTAVTGGSRTAFATGWAAIDAAEDVKRQMIERAAKIWDTDVENVQYSKGVFTHGADPELKMTFKELAGRLIGTGGGVAASASVEPTGQAVSVGTHIVDVEVDPDTGKVTILRYTAVQDAGKAIHPSYVEGQMQGGVVQGIGWALNEEYYFNDNGQMVNSSLLDYRMPTSLDLPMIDTIIVEQANPGHRYGAKGVGEIPIVPPMAAIANAIYDAVGVRMKVLPMSPGAVLEALWEKNGG